MNENKDPNEAQVLNESSQKRESSLAISSTSVLESEATDEKSPDSSTMSSFSLCLIAIALLLSYVGDIQQLTDSHLPTWVIARSILATAYIWWINAEIASSLKRLFLTKQDGLPLPLFRYNYIAIVALGICQVVSCFDIDEDSFLGMALGIVIVIALICWLVTQTLVSIKLISKNIVTTGISIITYLIVVIAGGIILSDLSFSHDAETYYIVYGLEFIASICMYAAYKKYFKSLINNKS